ncbi:MAG: tetratricopeptide repeat protein [bacterium]|nr:tetratricopeptide repeat protein [bacterium]
MFKLLVPRYLPAPRSLGVVGFLVVILVAGAVYYPVLGFDFINLDDPQLVYQNYLVRSFSPKIFTTYDPELYIPLTLLTYQIEHAFIGLQPLYYHLVNLIIHGANAMLLLCILRKLLRTDSWLLPLLGALIFVVHPLHTETVVWVSARKDLLSGFFFLFALLSYLHNKKKAGILFFVLALLSKVTAITLIPVLFLVDFLQGKPLTRASITSKLPYMALGTVFSGIALGGKTENLSALSIAEFVLLACKSVIFYLQKLVVPTDLSILYPWTEPIVLLSFDFMLPVLLFLVVVLMLVFTWQHKKDVFFGLAFFLVTLAPSLLTFSKAGDVYFASDRYAYIPSIGIIYLLLIWIAQSRLRSNTVMTLGVILLITFGVASRNHSQVWRNSEVLFLDVLTKYPQAHISEENLGHLYLMDGRTEEAVAHLERALTLKSTSFAAHNNLGFIRMMQGQYRTGLAHFQASIELNSAYAPAHVNVGVWHAKQGDYAIAEQALKNAIELDPYMAQAYFNLAGVYLKRGDDVSAKAFYAKTLELEPGHPDAIRQLQTW